jgi:hypothetical protein
VWSPQTSAHKPQKTPKDIHKMRENKTKRPMFVEGFSGQLFGVLIGCPKNKLIVPKKDKNPKRYISMQNHEGMDQPSHRSVMWMRWFKEV